MELQEFMETERQIQREFQDKIGDSTKKTDSNNAHMDDKVCLDYVHPIYWDGKECIHPIFIMFSFFFKGVSY